MKRFVKIISFLSLLFISGIFNVTTIAEEDYSVGGGVLNIDFEEQTDLDYFDVYSVFDLQPKIVDGAVVFNNQCEQKLILKDYTPKDFIAEMDIIPLISNGRIDCGFYILASNPSDKLDGINALNINVEHEINATNFKIKIHAFNHYYLGSSAEVSGIKYQNDCVHLKVVVKSGVLYVFVNYEDSPRIVYNVGTSVGMIGVRSFRSPSRIDNMRFIGVDFSLNKTKLSNLLALAKEYIDSEQYTDNSKEYLSSIYEEALLVYGNSNNGDEVIVMEEKLEEAIDGLVKKYTYNDLINIINSSKEFLNYESKYTKNSFNSLKAAIELASAVNEDSSQEDLSYWCEMVNYRINSLIEYREVE